MFSCESLILLLTGILVRAELEVTNPRGYDIEDTGYCMVDAGSKGKAVFEFEEVVQPVLIGRVALGEVPRPKVKKPASVDTTVEAVIETRQPAEDHVGTVARPEPMGITGATGDPPSPVGNGVLAEKVDSQGEFEPGRKRVNPWKPAVRLVHLKCGKKFKLAGPLAEDVDDEDAICEGLTRRARQIDSFNQALHDSIPRIGEVRQKGPGKSMFDVCTKAVHEVAAKLEKTGFGGESEKNRVFVERLCDTRVKEEPAEIEASSPLMQESTCCSGILCFKAGEFCEKSCCGVTCPAKTGVGWWVLK